MGSSSIFVEVGRKGLLRSRPDGRLRVVLEQNGRAVSHLREMAMLESLDLCHKSSTLFKFTSNGSGSGRKLRPFKAGGGCLLANADVVAGLYAFAKGSWRGRAVLTLRPLRKRAKQHPPPGSFLERLHE